ncbi:MAG: hypothetical protein IIT64_03645 [Bacteroidaceae bacterium]|nr:hypothetical protein [Bacteroidaceae bacterium]
MAKSSGTTRTSVQGTSEREAPRVIRQFNRNLRLSDVEANLVAGKMLGKFQLMVQRVEVGGVNMYVSGFVKSGTSTFTTNDATFNTPEQALQAAEEMVKQQQEFEREGYSPEVKAMAEKAANGRVSDAERELLRAHDYTFYSGMGFVDIYRGSKRVAKGIRKNGKLQIKWY